MINVEEALEALTRHRLLFHEQAMANYMLCRDAINVTL